MEESLVQTIRNLRVEIREVKDYTFCFLMYCLGVLDTIMIWEAHLSW